MHNAVVDRREIQTGLFLNRKRIGIGAQHDTGHAGAARDLGHDAVTGHLGPIGNGEAIEELADDGGGIRLLAA
ncbi:MAG: hypothetical protein U0412_05970 [Nitrospira sp.]